MSRTRLPSLAQYSGLALLLATCWTAYDHFQTGRTRFASAGRDLGEAGSLAQQIKLLRRKPDRAAISSRSEQSLADAIEKSAVEAGVAREQIARIEPQPPRRAGESDYIEHGTTVQMDGIRLEQLAKSIHELRGVAGLDQLRVSALRISAPYQATAEGPETWNVEFTLTYPVYSPKPTARRRS